MTIKEYCNKRGITMSQLAYTLGVHVSYISKLEHHQIRPNSRIKKALTELGIEINLEDISVYKSRKNEVIQQLREENKYLKEENKYLKNKLMEKIEQFLDKQLQRK